MIEPMTLARPYARAAFDFADGAQALGAWATALSQLATIAGDVTVEKLLKDPAKTASARADAVTTLIDGDVPMGLKNFLHIASDHGRLALLPEMAQQFTELKAAREATVEVEVISALRSQRLKHKNWRMPWPSNCPVASALPPKPTQRLWAEQSFVPAIW